MPGRPSHLPEIESPTGCTKQLMKVACSRVPAAELIRPAGTNPAVIAARNFFSQWTRFFAVSTRASARATRRCTSATDRSPAARTGARRLDVAAHDPDVILELAARRREGVADGDIGVLVRLSAGFVAHRQQLARHRQADVDLVPPALVMMPVRRLQGDVATGDAVAEMFEL